MSTDLVRPASSIAWELRGAWASGRRVSLRLSERCAPMERVEGWVYSVAATSAFVVVAGWQVPMEVVLSVHLPSRLGDSTVAEDERFHGRGRAVRAIPGQLAFD